MKLMNRPHGLDTTLNSLRRWLVQTGAAMLLSTLTVTSVQAIQITVDPDAFAAGTDISNAFPGVTLSAVGSGVVGGNSIFAVNPSTQPSNPFTASTGNLVFGTNNPVNPHIFTSTAFLFDFDPTKSIFLRADFATPTDFVSIDYIPSKAGVAGALYGFNSQNDLVNGVARQHQSLAPASLDIFGSNIAYILATVAEGGGGLDNLKFNAPDTAAVPEPSTLLLLGLGLVGVGLTARRRHRG